MNPRQVGLVAKGYSAIVALQLSLLQKELYNVITLANPIVDIGAMSSSLDQPEWPYNLMGVNYTTASVATDILASSWQKYVF